MDSSVMTHGVLGIFNGELPFFVATFFPGAFAEDSWLANIIGDGMLGAVADFFLLFLFFATWSDKHEAPTIFFATRAFIGGSLGDGVLSFLTHAGFLDAFASGIWLGGLVDRMFGAITLQFCSESLL